MYDELVKRLRLAKAVLSRNKDLIALLSDAAEAIEELSKQHEAQQENIVVLLDIIENDRNEIEWLKKCLNDLPKPVRCRDCIHLSGVTNGGTFFRCDRYDRWQDESNRVYMPLDGFCSYGQKKEET